MDEYPSDSVKPETHGFRDESISRRHRMYGFNCPAADLDFLLVEFKDRKSTRLNSSHSQQSRMPSSA